MSAGLYLEFPDEAPCVVEKIDSTMNDNMQQTHTKKKLDKPVFLPFPVPKVSHLKSSLDVFIAEKTNNKEHLSIGDSTKKPLKKHLSLFPSAIPTASFSKPPTQDASKILWRVPRQIQAPVATMIKPISTDDKMDHKASLINQGTIRELTVARYGRIYKRKAPSKMGYQCVQSLEGYRFCKFCNANLPLTAFYATTKRYVCRRHHYRRVIQNIIKRKREDPMWVIAKRAWLKMNRVRFIFGYDKLRYDIGDMRSIFIALRDILPLSDIMPLCVPIDCDAPMRIANNIAVISSRAFSILMKLYSFVPYRSIYIAFVQRMNLLPRNFDVGCPSNPFHNSKYRRVDINVSDIFAEEYKKDPAVHEWSPENLAKTLIESQDHDVIAEFRLKDKVPWLECEGLPPGEAGKWVDGKPTDF